MGLIEQAKKDIEVINSDLSAFGVELVWFNPLTPLIEPKTIIGRHVKHHLGFDEFGKLINSKNASCSFSERAMIDANYVIRTSGEVNLKGHLVDIKDSTGSFYKYKVKQWLPDETIGMVVCILEAYEQ